MNQNILHVGLDVDDTQYHGSAFNQQTGEVIDFKCRPTLKGLHLVETGASPTTINATLTGLGFLFGVTLERPEALKRTRRVRPPQKLPRVLSVEEVERLLAGASNPKHRAALAVAYGAGLRASEVVQLKVTDIDSDRMFLRVEQGKGRRDR